MAQRAERGASGRGNMAPCAGDGAPGASRATPSPNKTWDEYRADDMWSPQDMPATRPAGAPDNWKSYFTREDEDPNSRSEFESEKGVANSESRRVDKAFKTFTSSPRSSSKSSRD